MHELNMAERIMLAGIRAREQLLQQELRQLAGDRDFVLGLIAQERGLTRDALVSRHRIDLQSGEIVAEGGADGQDGEGPDDQAG